MIREHVGRRINLYRKKQNLTLEQLAALIHKSTSTVSKYELGKISIDLDTLADLADALHVSIDQLIDYRREIPVRKERKEGFFFTRSSRFYVYQYFAPMKKIVVSAFEIIPDPSSEEDRLMFYYDIDSTENYTDANFIYDGMIHYYDSYVTLRMVNLFGGVQDEMYIYAKNPFWTRNITTGSMMCLSQTLGNPTATTVAIATEPVPDEEFLKETLSLYSNKEVLNTMKRTNYLMLVDTWEKML